MVFKIIQENKLVGFTYYPLLEIIFGIFCLFMSFFVPFLFYRYNGFKLEQWGEWLFLIVFFIVFILLGSSLSYQNMKVELKDNILFLRQDMRSPDVKIELKLSDWKGVIKDSIEEKGEKRFFIKIKNNSEVTDFYNSINSGEANQITDLLNKIYIDNKGEENGTK